MQINAQPLKAYQTEEIIAANGNPKMLVAVEVTQIGESNLTPQGSATSSSPSDRQGDSSFRLMRSSRKGYKQTSGGTKQGEFTIASPDDYKKKGSNKYILRGGDDHHFGGSGKDNIAGGNGDDRLIGSTGDDYLRGGSGSDVLYGGQGNNKLEGGAGTDYFVIESSNTIRGSLHLILDANKEDVIVFSGYDQDDIKSGKKGRILADGNIIAILQGANKNLTNLLISEAIYN
jgi:Ca2+-binding RTX toxin-like protein